MGLIWGEGGATLLEGVDDLAAGFDEVEFAGVAPEDFAVGGEEDGVGECAGPFGVDGFGEGVGVFADPVVVVGGAAVFFEGRGGVVREGGVAGLEEFFDGWAFGGWVEGDGDEVEVAVLEAAVGIDEVGEFLHAGSAGGGPEVDESDVAAAVGADFFGEFGVEVIDGDGLFLPVRLVRGDVVLFEEPLGGAAEGAGDGFLDGLAGEDGVEGVGEVAFFDGAFFAAGVVHASGVAEFAFGIEDEDVRGALGAAGGGEELFFAVVEVVEGPAVVGGEGFHFLEGVAVG